MEILALYANKSKHDHVHVLKVAKYDVCTAWTYDLRTGTRWFPSIANRCDAAREVKARPCCADYVIAALYRRNLHLENGVFCIRFTFYAS